MDLGERYRSYPPRGRLLVPASLGRSGAAAVATTMACRPMVVALHHLAYAAVRLGGTRALLTPAAPLPATVSGQDLNELCDAVSVAVGRIDCIAVLLRRQELRDGVLGLAFRDSQPVAFIKAAPSATASGLEVERACLEVLSGDGTAPCLIPRMLGSGTAGTLRWNAIAALPPRPHRPAYSCDANAIATWIQDRLEAARPTLPTGHDIAPAPSHWRPMHGDFAPWNLRKILRGPTAVFDFEDASLAPPSADMTYWTATSAVLRGRHVTGVLEAEAQAFWIDRVQTRLAAGLDPEADQRLLKVLEHGGH